MSPYATPYTVWADKTGRIPAVEDNEAMRQGRDLEEYVAYRFCEETGKRCRRKNAILKNTDYPFAHANVDRWVVSENAGLERCRRKNAILKNTDYPFAHANVDRWVVSENAGLECKTTTTLSLKKFKNGEFPDTYYCQCMHYMAVTGADRWYLAVLVLGRDFMVFTIERDEEEITSLMEQEESFWRYVENDEEPPDRWYLAVLVLGRDFMVFTIERDEEEITSLMEQEESFWRYVENDEEPPVDGLDPTDKAIGTIYADVQIDGSVDLMGMECNIRNYLDIKVSIKEMEQLLKQREQEIKMALGECPRGTVGNLVVNWKPQERKTFKVKDFAADHPDVDLGPYYKTTVFRKFEIKEDN